MSAVDWQLELSLQLAGWANFFFPAHASPFPSFIPISFFFFFLPAGFLQAFNQGQYVLNQHFSFFMQHCPLKLFAAGWRLNCCQYPLRAPPRRAHIGHLLRALQVPRRQLGLECISGSAYQAWQPSGVPASRSLTLRWWGGAQEGSKQKACSCELGSVSYRKEEPSI